jgi:hypothetical protein
MSKERERQILENLGSRGMTYVRVPNWIIAKLQAEFEHQVYETGHMGDLWFHIEGRLSGLIQTGFVDEEQRQRRTET